jgi:hypothetical protein
MLGYDVEIFEANGEKTISTSYPNIYILLPSQWTSAKRAKINTRLNGQYRSTFIFSIAVRGSSVVKNQALLKLECSRLYFLFRSVAVLIQAFQIS